MADYRTIKAQPLTNVVRAIVKAGGSTDREAELVSTNLVEAINGQLEIMRRNSGGFFHSDETLKCKLGIAVSSLENGRWNASARKYGEVLLQLNAMFGERQAR